MKYTTFQNISCKPPFGRFPKMAEICVSSSRPSQKGGHHHHHRHQHQSESTCVFVPLGEWSRWDQDNQDADDICWMGEAAQPIISPNVLISATQHIPVTREGEIALSQWEARIGSGDFDGPMRGQHLGGEEWHGLSSWAWAVINRKFIYNIQTGRK